jgi:hypothetical protein
MTNSERYATLDEFGHDLASLISRYLEAAGATVNDDEEEESDDMRCQLWEYLDEWLGKRGIDVERVKDYLLKHSACNAGSMSVDQLDQPRSARSPRERQGGS